MLTRIMTSVIGIPLVIAIIVIGNPLLRYVMMVVSVIALYEFYGVVRGQNKPIKYMGYCAIIVQYLAFDWVIQYYAVYMVIVVMISLSILVVAYPKYSIIDVALTLFPVIYVGLMFSFMVSIRDLEQGHFWVWLIAISAWGCDTFAYFTGKTIGKHKLAPKLSPKKTIEGSIGGVIGAGILGYIYTIIFTYYDMYALREKVFWVVAAVTIGAIISQFGDLAASAVKRYYEQKDYGYILPGHGGILDRFDSFLFVAPIIFLVAQFVQDMMV